MDDDHLSEITKIGISVSSILTVSLILLNRAFYYGFFFSFGATIAQSISVDMRDLLTPQIVVVSKFTAFLFGYLFAYECIRDRRVKRVNETRGIHNVGTSNSENRKPFYEKYVHIVLFSLIIIAMVFSFAMQEIMPFAFGLTLNILGFLFYHSLKLFSVQIRWYSAGLLVCLALFVTFFDGVLKGSQSKVRATIQTVNEEIIENAKYIYANSESFFIVRKKDSNKLSCIPRSQVREIMIYAE
ncbi:hypothetical protein Pan153_53340 [Gimesia panareensis]|uniref:Uncharacterized protein n=1 Tax=Gimesia panareensis TaxID=2527978 RepID=A0A518FWC5_9PLAN|nr:hypothetical protein [Gimesia panareensis]QDV20658.1 hypothetical protein Pan153_53340 [Gimesia panareensis]